MEFLGAWEDSFSGAFGFGMGAVWVRVLYII